MSKWQYLLGRFRRQLWARSILYCVAGIGSALLAAMLGPLLPLGNVAWLGAGAVKDLLTIMASSMLAVATFSLSTMVSAYAAASGSTTPRAATLLIEDPTAQRALSTFVGAFLFSIVGLIALATGAYGDSGRAMLFLATVVVIGIVVATLLRWIDLLVHFGRVGDTIDRIETVTRRALLDRVRAPNLGGADAVDIADDAVAVHATRIGYVRHIDMGRLQSLAGDGARRVHVLLLPGAFTDPARPLARLEGDWDETATAAAVESFTVGGSRTFEQDPRFGLIVLTEIALRALSPAVNDPGTAIDVVGTVSRLLCSALDEAHHARQSDETEGPAYPAVHVPRLQPDDVLGDVFHPVSRDGAGFLEVTLTLLRALRALQSLPDDEYAAAAQRLEAPLLARAEAAMTLTSDFATLRAAAG